MSIAAASPIQPEPGLARTNGRRDRRQRRHRAPATSLISTKNHRNVANPAFFEIRLRQPLKLRTRRFRDNFGTFEKWESSGFRGVSDTNEGI